jgi:hypothetical protein
MMKVRATQPDEYESQGAVAVTVAWMLTCMSTAVAMLVVLTLRLLIVVFPVPLGAVHPLNRIAGVLLFVALATGGLCLLFTPLVHRVRGVAPPRTITIGAIVIGLSPIVMLIGWAIAAL